MIKRYGTLIASIAMVLCLCLISSATASEENQDVQVVKDAAQLKMETLEAELGEEGMKEVADYLELQTSLPKVVKASPYSWIAFVATDKEKQKTMLVTIDEANLPKENEEQLKNKLQDIWNRYPDKITADDNIVLCQVNEIMENNFKAREELYKAQTESTDVDIRWAGSGHRDYAYYACDGSAYDDTAADASIVPDNGEMDPEPFYRYYNHYEDALLGIGGAPDRCEEFADSAIFAVNNGYWETAHERFGFASHYLTDPGIPFHSKGSIDGLGSFQPALFNVLYHTTYESYVSQQWPTGTTYEFGEYVSGNTQSITVTDPASAVEDNADHSAQYFDYITSEMLLNSNWRTDLMLNYYTAQCVQESARYAHGLYDYIM